MKKYLVATYFLVALLGNDAFAQWTNLSGPYGGTINSLAYDVTNSRAYAISGNSKLYTSNNDGGSWQQLNGVSYAYSVMVDGTTAYTSDWSSLYKSIDGGANWTIVSQNGFQYGRILKKVETNVYVIGGYGIWISLDAGVTWTLISDHTDYTYNLGISASGDIYYSHYSNDDSGYIVSRHQRPLDGVSWSTSTVEKVITTGISYLTSFGFQGSNIFVSGSEDIFKSATGDVGSWVSSKNGILESSLNGGVFCQNPAGDLFYFEPNYRKAYTTTSSSAGDLWTSLAWPSANFSNYNVVAAVAPTNSKMLVGTELDAVFFSSDNGVSWTPRSTNILEGEGTDIEIASDNTLYYKTGYYASGLWKSTTGGTSWTFMPAPPYRSLFVSSNQTIFAYGNNNNRSIDQGANWSSIPGAYSIVEPSPGNIYSIGYGTSNIYYSNDEGAIWSNVTISGLPGYAGDMYFAAHDASTLFILLRNYNDGSTSDDDRAEVYKVTLSDAITGSATLALSAAIANNEYAGKFFAANGKIYYTTTRNIYYSADVGDTWQSFAFENNGVMPIQGGLCLSTYGTLLVTQDDGKSFNSTTLPNGNAYILDIVTDSNGDYFASAANSGGLKFTNELIVDPLLLPPYIEFDWQPLNGPFGGGYNRKIMESTFDNSFLLFSDNKIFRNTDPASNSWANISKNNTQNSYVYDYDLNPVNNDYYTVEWSTLYKSSDLGQTWAQVPNSENLYGRQFINSFSDGKLLLTRNYNSAYSFHVSSDGGQTFGTELLSMPNNNINVYDVTITPTDVAFVRYYDYNLQTYLLKRTEDFGATWEDVTVPIANFDGLTFDAGGNVYLAEGPGNIFVSVDNGDNWTNISGDASSVSYSMGQRKVWVSPSGELYFGGYSTAGPQGFFRSVDQGVSWQFMGDLDDILQASNIGVNQIYDLAWSGSTMIIAAYGFVFESTDGGATIVEANQGIDNLGFSELELMNQSKLIAFGSGNGSYQSTDLTNWSKVPTINSSKILKLTDGSILAYGGYQSIMKTQDGGTTWSTLSSSFPGPIQKLATFNEVNFYALISNSIYTTTDFENWTQIPINGLPSNPNINDFMPFSGGRIYVVHYNNQSSLNELYRIQFSSATRVNIGQSPGHIQLFDGKLLVYDVRGGLFKSTDGTTWTQNGAPGNGDKLIVTERDYFFIPVSNLGLWLSRDLGTTWQNVGAFAGSYNDRFTDVVINEYDGYAYATFNSGPVRKSANIVVPDDETAPLITSLFPAPGATNVGARPELRITFDEPVSPEATFNIIIVDQANNVIPAAIIDVSTELVEQDGKTFIYRPSTALAYNKSYFVVIDEKRVNGAPPPAELGAFKDIFGNPFDGLQDQNAWTFSTQPSPTVNTLSPADNSTEVSVVTPLSITFSETMSLASGKQIVIRKSSDNSLLETLGYCVPQEQFTSVSNSPLVANRATVLAFDATKGDGALTGANKVYAYTYAIASKEADPTPYYFVIGNWGQDDGVGEMTLINGETDKWELALAPSIREYFGVPLNYRIDSIGVVFRNSNGTVRANPPSTVEGGYVWQNQFGDYDVFFDLNNSSTLTFELCTPLEFNTSYYIQAEALAFESADGVPLTYVNASTAWNFTTGAMPIIDLLSPTNNSSGVVLYPTLSLTFNTTVEGVADKFLYVRDASDASLVETISVVDDLIVSGNGFNFNLPNALDYAKQYYITADAGAFQKNGVDVIVLQGDTEWTFSTTEAPTATPTLPAHNATGVDLLTEVSLTFSEPVYAVSGTFATIYTSSNAVVTQISLDGLESDVSNVLTIPLDVTLNYSTQYEIRFDANSFQTVDLVPFSVLSNDGDWVFTTHGAPTAVTLSPANNTTGVDLITEVSLTFSEPVNGVSGTFATIYTSSNALVTQISLSGLESDNGGILTIPLGITLDFNTQYEIRFDANSFQTVDLVPFSVLSNDDDWVFTTRSAPTVVTLSPVNNAIDVAQRPTVAITFSDPVTVVNGGSVGFNPSPSPSTPFAFSDQGVVSDTNPNMVEFTLSSTDLNFSTAYYLKVTADAFSYKGRTFSVLTGDNEWNITVEAAPDGVAPVFDSFTPPLFIKNSTSNGLTVGVTDASSAIASVKLFHRKLRSEGAFTEVAMTSSSGNNYTIPVSASMLDELGLEYYFTATDASPTPNEKRMPASTDDYLSSGIRMENSDEPVLPSSVVGTGGQPSSYRIFSIPFKLDNASIPTVFSELGEPNKELYRLLTYNKSKPNGWAEYNDDFNSIERGKGYWINSKIQVTLKLEGASTENMSKAEPFVFNLAAGWNQIGNPYPFTIDWVDVKGNNTSVGNLYKFSNGSYSQGTTTLGAYEGGFVFVDGNSSVQLNAPLSLGNGARVSRGGEDFSKGWILPIMLTQGKYTNDFTAVGMHPDADLSSDQFDNVTPPRFIEYLEANFAHPEHSGRNFSRDIVPTSSEHIWEFTVDSNIEGPANFTWSYPQSIDFARELFLFDVARQQPIDMRSNSSYTFNPMESSSFKIYYGENFKSEFSPDHVALGQAYPNPTSGELTITFSLPENGGQTQLVEVEIIDAVGRSLGTVATGTYPAGYHEIGWNGEAKFNNAGLFTYRLKVLNKQGNEVLQGKIMVKK